VRGGLVAFAVSLTLLLICVMSVFMITSPGYPRCIWTR
jgi:hypothetical protein